MANKNLIVVRAGDSSFHKNWLVGRKDFDLCVSYYGKQVGRFRGDSDVMYEERQGGKWDSIADLLKRWPAVFSSYDFVCFADDDLDATGDAWSECFDVAAEQSLDLCQPSLSPASPVFWEHLHQEPGKLLRFTNMVEIQAPILSRRALRVVLPTLLEQSGTTGTGWGMDVLWSYMLYWPDYRAAVIDKRSVTHTRPPGQGTLRQYYVTQAIDPGQEFYRLIAKYCLPNELKDIRKFPVQIRGFIIDRESTNSNESTSDSSSSGARSPSQQDDPGSGVQPVAVPPSYGSGGAHGVQGSDGGATGVQPYTYPTGGYPVAVTLPAGTWFVAETPVVGSAGDGERVAAIKVQDPRQNLMYLVERYSGVGKLLAVPAAGDSFTFSKDTDRAIKRILDQPLTSAGQFTLSMSSSPQNDGGLGIWSSNGVNTNNTLPFPGWGRLDEWSGYSEGDSLATTQASNDTAVRHAKTDPSVVVDVDIEWADIATAPGLAAAQVVLQDLRNRYPQVKVLFFAEPLPGEDPGISHLQTHVQVAWYWRSWNLDQDVINAVNVQLATYKTWSNYANLAVIADISPNWVDLGSKMPLDLWKSKLANIIYPWCLQNNVRLVNLFQDPILPLDNDAKKYVNAVAAQFGGPQQVATS